jgi:hypothetical protein
MAMNGRVMRVQRRDAWLPIGPGKLPLAEAEDVEQVVVPREVVLNLTQQLYAPARARGGMLFGYMDGSCLRIVLVSSVGEPRWYAGGPRSVLEVDTRFTLGWSEALFNTFQGRLDWCGNWMAHPDGELRGTRRDERLYKKGLRQGFFDDRSVLLLVGWMDGAFTLRAYRRDPDAHVEEVPCETAQETQIDLLRRILESL